MDALAQEYEWNDSTLEFQFQSPADSIPKGSKSSSYGEIALTSSLGVQ